MIDKSDLTLPQLPAFFGSITASSVSPTKSDPLTFEEEVLSPKKILFPL